MDPEGCGPLPGFHFLHHNTSFCQGTLTAQGKLLQQDTFYVIELDAGMQSRTKERRVFLFEQIVIFSELLRKGSLTPGYMFKRSIKVRLPVRMPKGKEEPNRGSCFPGTGTWRECRFAALTVFQPNKWWA